MRGSFISCHDYALPQKVFMNVLQTLFVTQKERRGWEGEPFCID